MRSRYGQEYDNYLISKHQISYYEYENINGYELFKIVTRNPDRYKFPDYIGILYNNKGDEAYSIINDTWEFLIELDNGYFTRWTTLNFLEFVQALTDHILTCMIAVSDSVVPNDLQDFFGMYATTILDSALYMLNFGEVELPKKLRDETTFTHVGDLYNNYFPDADYSYSEYLNGSRYDFNKLSDLLVIDNTKTSTDVWASIEPAIHNHLNILEHYIQNNVITQNVDRLSFNLQVLDELDAFSDNVYDFTDNTDASDAEEFIVDELTAVADMLSMIIVQEFLHRFKLIPASMYIELDSQGDRYGSR